MTVDEPGPGPLLDDRDVLDVLARGELEVEGRLLDASNATLVGTVELDGVGLRCVYKPVAGERPLWDFPDRTLGHREVAAYEVSAATPWSVVPPTAWREDGPFGEGMCQQWVETADTSAGAGDAGREGPDLVDVVPPGEVPPGWRTVVRAQGGDGRPVVLVHADDPALRRMALLDVVLNNADRKGGHVLVDPSGEVRGIDHGVTFHVEHKLRTVLWGWAGEAVPDDLLDDLRRLRTELDGALGARLDRHLSVDEVDAVRDRVDVLLEDPVLPLPSESWPAIPWPVF